MISPIPRNIRARQHAENPKTSCGQLRFAGTWKARHFLGFLSICYLLPSVHFFLHPTSRPSLGELHGRGFPAIIPKSGDVGVDIPDVAFQTLGKPLTDSFSPR